MNSEDEVVVTIEPEVTEGQQVAEKTDADEAAAALQAQIDEHKAARQKAESDAAAALARAAEQQRAAEGWRQEATTARSTVVDSQLQTVLSGIESAETAASSAEAMLAAAMEKADYSAAAKAQRELAKAEARLELLNNAKVDLETRKTAPPPQQRQADPIESFISTRTPETAQWLRQHRDWLTDTRKNARLTAAHYDAEDAGLKVDTPEYFAFVETRIGLRKPDRERDESGRFSSKESAVQRKPAAPPAAPVNGGGGVTTVGAGNPNAVTLTQREAIAATDGTLRWNKADLKAGRIKTEAQIGTPIGHTEMARRKLAMQKAGHYDKSYTE